MKDTKLILILIYLLSRFPASLLQSQRTGELWSCDLDKADTSKESGK
jgi:hypothetical protein